MQKGARIAVFVDRDGTICFDRHYLSDPNGLELIPTVAEGIKRLNDAKMIVIKVTNQSGFRRDETFFSVDIILSQCILRTENGQSDSQRASLSLCTCLRHRLEAGTQGRPS